MSDEESPPTFEECLAEVSTYKRQQYCREYLLDMIQSRAAERAGYAEASSHVEGSRLMRDPKIRAAISAGLRELAEDSHVSRAWVLERLKLNVVESYAKGEIQASNRALATLAKSLGMLDKDLNINLRSDQTAKVVMYFPDNERGPKPKGKDDERQSKSGSDSPGDEPNTDQSG